MIHNHPTDLKQKFMDKDDSKDDNINPPPHQVSSACQRQGVANDFIVFKVVQAGENGYPREKYGDMTLIIRMNIHMK